MTDDAVETIDAVESIRAVSDRAMNEIAPGSTVVPVPVDFGDSLLLAALANSVDPGGADLSGSRLKLVRRAMLKLIRPSTETQSAFNTDVHRALSHVMSEIRSGHSATAAVRAGLSSAEILAETAVVGVDNLREAVNSRLEDIVNRQDARLDVLEASVEKLAASVERSQGELARHRAVVDLALRELRSSLPTDGPDLEAVTRPLDESYDRFYDDFESVFRGTREQVMERQREYLALVADIPGPVLDIGPGRGEWLELLRNAGISASGVDTNSEFVAGCTDRGLDVIHADAFDHLRKVPESSLGAITAFQVVEHLPFEVLVDLLGLCLVALRPGGVLILETPNPSNLKVGAMTFWNDPSHVHPLPPHMLEFLVKWRGFVDAKTHFPEATATQSLEIAGVDSGALDDINWAMFGPLDYAIVARRP